jgi:hypothetical protein
VAVCQVKQRPGGDRDDQFFNTAGLHVYQVSQCQGGLSINQLNTESYQIYLRYIPCDFSPHLTVVIAGEKLHYASA